MTATDEQCLRDVAAYMQANGDSRHLGDYYRATAAALRQAQRMQRYPGRCALVAALTLAAATTDDGVMANYLAMTAEDLAMRLAMDLEVDSQLTSDPVPDDVSALDGT